MGGGGGSLCYLHDSSNLTVLLLRGVNHLAHITFACSSYSCFAPGPPFPVDALW